MTEITEFLNNINRQPSCLAEVDWIEQTGMFYSERICEILVGIEDDDVCKLAMEYIADGWSEAEEFEPFEMEEIMQSFMKKRALNLQRKLRKKTLDEKARRLGKKEKQNEVADIINGPYACDNLFSSHYYQEYLRLRKENESLRMELEKCKKDSRYSVDKSKLEGIRSVVEQLIVFGEKFPSNQNDKAEIIREALLMKSFDGHIPSDALTPEWKARLKNLGRKEIGLSFQGDSMFKITGNDQVNIGGNNGGQ